MSRLTNLVRKITLENALAKSNLPKRKAALKKKRADWAERVRVEAIGGPEVDKKIKSIERRLRKTLAELPEKVISGQQPFRKDYDITMNIAGQSYVAKFSGIRKSEPYKDRVTKVAPWEHTLTASKKS